MSTGRKPGVPTVSFFRMDSESGEKFVLLILLLLIFAASSRDIRADGHSTEDINKSNHTIVPYVQKIRDNIQKRMMLTIDELIAVYEQLDPQQRQVNASGMRKQLQEKMSQMKRALQNCEIQVSRIQRRDKANLLCGQ